MANSTYNVLEVRLLDEPEKLQCRVFVRIDHPTDFAPVGGWYGRTIPYTEGTPTMEVLDAALRSQDYLMWDREAPDATNQWMQDEIKTLREQLMDQHMRYAELVASLPARPN